MSRNAASLAIVRSILGSCWIGRMQAHLSFQG